MLVTANSPFLRFFKKLLFQGHLNSESCGKGLIPICRLQADPVLVWLE